MQCNDDTKGQTTQSDKIPQQQWQSNKMITIHFGLFGSTRKWSVSYNESNQQFAIWEKSIAACKLVYYRLITEI